MKNIFAFVIMFCGSLVSAFGQRPGNIPWQNFTINGKTFIVDTSEFHRRTYREDGYQPGDDFYLVIYRNDGPYLTGQKSWQGPDELGKGCAGFNSFGGFYSLSYQGHRSDYEKLESILRQVFTPARCEAIHNHDVINWLGPTIYFTTDGNGNIEEIEYGLTSSTVITPLEIARLDELLRAQFKLSLPTQRDACTSKLTQFETGVEVLIANLYP